MIKCVNYTQGALDPCTKACSLTSIATKDVHWWLEVSNNFRLRVSNAIFRSTFPLLAFIIFRCRRKLHSQCGFACKLPDYLIICNQSNFFIVWFQFFILKKRESFEQRINNPLNNIMMLYSVWTLLSLYYALKYQSIVYYDSCCYWLFFFLIPYHNLWI